MYLKGHERLSKSDSKLDKRTYILMIGNNIENLTLHME